MSADVGWATGNGLTAEYFNNASPLGIPAVTRTDSTINFDWGTGSPDPAVTVNDGFSARWTGKITPKYTEPYTFVVETCAAAEADPGESYKVWVNDTLLLNTWDADPSTGPTLQLQADQSHDLKVEYKEGTGRSKIIIKWISPSSLKEILPTPQLTPSVENLPTGSILREYWENVPGDQIDVLNNDLDGNRPNGANYLTDLVISPADPIGIGNDVNDFGQRLRGYLIPPQTGAYTFHVEGTDAIQLWLSQDTSPNFQRNIAEVTSSGRADSLPIHLREGHKYYIEVLHKAGSSEDQLDVRWTLPGTASETTIPATALVPFRSEVRLYAIRSVTYEQGGLATDPATFRVVRNDDFGHDLFVHYTVGGSAENGTDFALLSGTVMIPQGEASAPIEITGTPDGPDGPEYVLLRLAPSTAVIDQNTAADPETEAYVLATESSKLAEATIYDQLPTDADAVLPGDPLVNMDGRHGNGSHANFTTIPNLDDALPFPNILRVEVNNLPANPWSIRPVWFPRQTVNEDDVLQVTFWVRVADGANEFFQVQAQFESNDGRNRKPGVFTAHADDQWTKYSFAFRSDTEYTGWDGEPGTTPSATSAKFFINLGYQTGTLEIGGLTMTNYGDSKPADYDGRDATEPWRVQAEQGIEQNRKGDLTVHVTDGLGNPVSGAQVHVRQIGHDFGFGTSITRFEILDFSNDPAYKPDPEDAQRYGALVETLFNKTTAEGAFLWNLWEPFPVIGRLALDWANDRELPFRGHNLVWGRWSQVPDRVRSGFLDVLAAENQAAADEWLKGELLAHIANEAGENFVSGLVPSNGDPRVSEWNVINHPLTDDDFWGTANGQAMLGVEVMVELFEAARDAAHSATQLYINEGRVLANSQWAALAPPYHDLIQRLLDPVANGMGEAPIDGIGFMTHFDSRSLTPIEVLISRLDRFSEFGKTLQSTEFDVDSDYIDDQTQADYTRDFLNLMFSYADTNAVNVWGFWENRQWLSEVGAHMFAEDWGVKPNGQTWLDLVHQEWMTRNTGTTWSDGSYTSRAFYGDYEITGEINGQPYIVTRHFTGSGPITVIPPMIAALTDTPDPVVDGDNVTLVAHSVADSDGNVLSVSFYRDANGDGVPQAGELLGTDSDDTDGWSLTVSTSGFPLGTHTYLAQATDDDGLTSTVVSTTGELTTSQSPASVVGRHIFYNNSAFDGNDAAANAGDDNAMAPNPTSASDPTLGKTALLPGQTATFQNYTSFSQGINGIMIDIANLANPMAVTSADFAFRVGNDNNPDGWPLAPMPASVTVREDAGDAGSDRVTIVWADNAVEKTWLQVTVLATANTGLPAPDVHYWGNAVGDSGNAAGNTQVNATDELNARFNQHNFLDPAPLDDFVDYDRDARVNATDELIARFNQTSFLTDLNLISVPEAPAAASKASVVFANAIDIAASQVELNRRDGLLKTDDTKSNPTTTMYGPLQVRQAIRHRVLALNRPRYSEDLAGGLSGKGTSQRNGREDVDPDVTFQHAAFAKKASGE